MIAIQSYSSKGLALQGASEEQAKQVAAQLGANVCTQYNSRLGGWVFSRKREDRIREIVAALNASLDDMPGPWTDARGKLIA